MGGWGPHGDWPGITLPLVHSSREGRAVSALGGVSSAHCTQATAFLPGLGRSPPSCGVRGGCVCSQGLLSLLRE